MTSSLRNLVASMRMLLVLTVLLGVLYPALVWGIGKLAFPAQADGSLVRRDGVVIGSSLLGQDFTDARFFHGRPSTSGYAGGVSGGSNLASGSAAQVKAVQQRSRAYAATETDATESGATTSGATTPGPIPADALTASGSGLDPHISPANARSQARRVAAANGLDIAAVVRLVDEHTQGRSLGFLGEPRVNVLELNVAIQAAAAR
jgi:K+-transporting ATPase ATPase C chain